MLYVSIILYIYIYDDDDDKIAEEKKNGGDVVPSKKNVLLCIVPLYIFTHIYQHLLTLFGINRYWIDITMY